MSRNTNSRLNHRNREQAYSEYWLAQNGEGASDSHRLGLSKLLVILRLLIGIHKTPGG